MNKDHAKHKILNQRVKYRSLFDEIYAKRNPKSSKGMVPWWYEFVKYED